MSPFPVDAFDVAIILGARIDPDGTPSPAMVRRVSHGVALLHGGRAGALLMTGGATTSAVPEARVMREIALDLGAPAERVHLEEEAANTIQNALFSARILHRQGWRRALVVTDSFHRPRTRYIFRRFGLSVAVAGVRPEQPTRDWWLAHLREAAALPWTILRVEALLLRAGRP
ncbi:MAG: YdcF family protein [Magnetospirillum sp.]|nr:YdcF family protein [Magnetospirillum sp.]